MYKHGSPASKIQSRRNLARLLPRALILSQERGADKQRMKAVSSLGAAAITHMSIDKVVGVHLYCHGPGKHHADLEFANLPLGIANVMGTPLEEPRASREEAEAFAVEMLAGFMAASGEGDCDAEPAPAAVVFEVDGFSFTFPQALVDLVAETRYFEECEAARCLDIFRNAMGGTFTAEGLDRLSPREMRGLHVAMISMLLRGTPRYPRRWPVA